MFGLVWFRLVGMKQGSKIVIITVNGLRFPRVLRILV